MEMWMESQLRQISNARDIESAYRMSLDLVQDLGFNFCAFSITSHARGPHFERVNLNNYPRDWNLKYEKDHYVDIDPILAHCNHSTLPILWGEEAYSKTPTLWQAQKQLGLQYGWSQSLHGDRGLCSMLSLARSNDPITPYELYEKLGYTIFISHQLHGLVAKKLPLRVNDPCKPHLSAREIEILRLSADGKTACEVGMILNITERTTNFHICSAIKKLGVNNKIAAVIAAARACMI
ncbi:autoinducer binding domain-containing protein [Pseudomonas sp. MDT2-39-1]|uniref:autoinducer binding domain-containing protein n=1 Tax=Pseudomonas sp. BGI-2 TaxID=2528211 RepID=UPI001034E6EA|nr:autoinducer binding domain-containing protein [Pseudomonas sp. BGI-2]TBN40758.1 LuxR family transcriptional regulator [Pseudomonas sp. BGI-2]